MKKFIILYLFGLSICIGQTTKYPLYDANVYANKVIKEHNIPGMAITVSKNDTIIWSKGFGYSNLQDSVVVLPHQTKFRIASISKPITAVGLGVLVDRNQLNFDESVYTYIKDFPKKKHDFTVRQVAGHIAGVRHYKGNEFNLNKKMSIVEGLDIFKDDKLLFKPGKKFNYSTYGWNLLSVVLQNASKTEFNTFIQEEIFKPLNMNNTLLDVPEHIVANRSQFYLKNKDGKLQHTPAVNNEFKVAGGGFISTSEDLIKFGNEIISPTIITSKTRDELVTSLKIKRNKMTYYGIGFGIGTSIQNTPKYSHSGGGMGATSLLLIYPEEHIVISILTNISGAPINEIGKTLEAIFLGQ